MRISRLLFAICAIVVTVACKQDINPPAPAPERANFEVTVHDTTRGSVTFSVEPLDMDAPYLCVVYSKAEYDEFTREDFLVEALFQELRDRASSVGKTFDEYMPEVVDRGVVTEAKFSGLMADTDYYIIIFGVDEADGYRRTTPISKTPFKTASVADVECEFQVSTSVKDNSVVISVAPSDKELQWYLCTMPKSHYDYYVVDEDGHNMSESYFYEYYFQQEINTLLQQGYTEQQVVDALIHKGDLQLEAKGLQEYTDYYLLVAGLFLDEDGIVICTDVQRGEYTTEGAARSTMTFDIEVWDIGKMEASFRITPSNNRDKYCALVAPWDGVTTAQEQMQKIVEQWGGWMEVMANDRGMVEHVGANAMRLPAADMDYYIIAFGYDGGVTTEACMKTFRTLPGGTLEEVEFTVSSTNASPYGFTMNITSSDPTIYYIPGICVADEYDEQTFVAGEQEIFDYYYAGSKEFNPSTTVCEVLDQYYYNGNCSVRVNGVQPDTEFMAYIFAFDVHTGKIVKTFTFDDVARTTTIGEANPSIELVGYFSGDDEAGAVFGDPAATKGRAITVVKYSNLDSVRTLFTTMVEGDCSNTSTYPDSELWSIADGYWKTCKVSSPYTFYLADWNVVQTALTYATDNSGKAGAIARLYTMPTAENKGDIEELKRLVDELNGNTRSQLEVPSLVLER